MIKTNNSFYQFSKDYITYFRDKSQEHLEKPQNPATQMNSFLRNSSFAKKSPEPIDWPSDIDLSKIRDEYLIVDPTQRFQREWNEKKLFVKHRQSPLRTEFFNKFRDGIRSLSKQYRIDNDHLQYEQQARIPSERKKELQNLVTEQKEYKKKKQQFGFINKQHRLIQNLHHDDEEIPNTTKHVNESTQSRIYYLIYQNTNQCIEFDNNFLQPKSKLNFDMTCDWARKKKSPIRKLDTFHRVISQEDTENSKLGVPKPNRMKQFEKRGREYNIINFVN